MVRTAIIHNNLPRSASNVGSDGAWSFSYPWVTFRPTVSFDKSRGSRGSLESVENAGSVKIREDPAKVPVKLILISRSATRDTLQRSYIYIYN